MRCNGSDRTRKGGADLPNPPPGLASAAIADPPGGRGFCVRRKIEPWLIVLVVEQPVWLGQECLAGW